MLKRASATLVTSSRAFSSHVRIVDVSPRDGLQNEKSKVSTATKLELIERLTNSGIKTIEAASFVSPKWVPQMADSKDIMPAILNKYAGNGVDYTTLTPNTKGLEAALDCTNGAIKEVAIFGAASEGFSMKNTNRTIAQGFDAFDEVVKLAQKNNVRVRAYLSTVVACPYDGPTNPKLVAQMTQRFLDMGCYEVSLGDTIGVGTPATIELMLTEVLRSAPADKLAIHAHDTYGQGVANVLKAVDMGIRVVDSCVAGLGGCPFANGATGNVSTEDVLYALHGLGFETGINLLELSKTGQWISEQLGRPNGSKAGKALLIKSLKESSKL